MGLPNDDALKQASPIRYDPAMHGPTRGDRTRGLASILTAEPRDLSSWNDIAGRYLAALREDTQARDTKSLEKALTSLDQLDPHRVESWRKRASWFERRREVAKHYVERSLAWCGSEGPWLAMLQNPDSVVPGHIQETWGLACRDARGEVVKLQIFRVPRLPEAKPDQHVFPHPHLFAGVATCNLDLEPTDAVWNSARAAFAWACSKVPKFAKMAHQYDFYFSYKWSEGIRGESFGGAWGLLFAQFVYPELASASIAVSAKLQPMVTNGLLEPVTDVESKTAAAARHGIKHVFVSDGCNCADKVDGTTTSKHSTLQEVLFKVLYDLHRSELLELRQLEQQGKLAAGKNRWRQRGYLALATACGALLGAIAMVPQYSPVPASAVALIAHAQPQPHGVAEPPPSEPARPAGVAAPPSGPSNASGTGVVAQGPAAEPSKNAAPTPPAPPPKRPTTRPPTVLPNPAPTGYEFKEALPPKVHAEPSDKSLAERKP